MTPYRDVDPAADAPEFTILSQRRPVARKVHTCAACGDPINVGEKYEGTAVIYEGEFLFERQHIDAGWHLSGCPKVRAAQLRELEE